MIVPVEIKLAIVLSLAVKSTIQDLADETCAGITSKQHPTAMATINVKFPNGKKPTAILPVGVTCSRTSDIYGYFPMFDNCEIRKPWVRVNSGPKTCGAFLVDGQLYALYCHVGAGPSIGLLETMQFSSCVLTQKGYSSNWHVEIPVADDANQATTLTVYFSRPDFNGEDFKKCSPFGIPTYSKGVKAGSVGIFVKNKSAYELQCLKNDPPKLRKADFLEEMCNPKKSEANVEVTGDNDNDDEKRITAMCVSFSCNKAKTEIAECKADCPHIGGGTNAGGAKVLTKNGKKFDFTCSKTEPPTITYKKE